MAAWRHRNGTGLLLEALLISYCRLAGQSAARKKFVAIDFSRVCDRCSDVMSAPMGGGVSCVLAGIFNLVFCPRPVWIVCVILLLVHGFASVFSVRPRLFSGTGSLLGEGLRQIHFHPSFAERSKVGDVLKRSCRVAIVDGMGRSWSPRAKSGGRSGRVRGSSGIQPVAATDRATE